MTTKPHTAARVIADIESDTRYRLDQAARTGASFALELEQRIDSLLDKLDLIRSQPVTPERRALAIELTAELHAAWDLQVDAETVATQDGARFLVTVVSSVLS